MLPSSSKYRFVVNERVPASSTFSGQQLYVAILYVNNVTKSDYGIYQCKVENSLGTDITDVALTGLSMYSIDLS
jgi:hypothetical protein